MGWHGGMGKLKWAAYARLAVWPSPSSSTKIHEALAEARRVAIASEGPTTGLLTFHHPLVASSRGALKPGEPAAGARCFTADTSRKQADSRQQGRG